MKRSGVIPSEFSILTENLTFHIGLLLTISAASSLRPKGGVEIEKHSSITLSTLVLCSNYYQLNLSSVQRFTYLAICCSDEINVSAGTWSRDGEDELETSSQQLQDDDTAEIFQQASLISGNFNLRSCNISDI